MVLLVPSSKCCDGTLIWVTNVAFYIFSSLSQIIPEFNTAGLLKKCH